MKIHVTVESSIRHDSEAKRRVLEQVRTVSGTGPTNLDRYERYGVLSIDADVSVVGRIRSIDGVKAVEVDAPRYALERCST